MASIPSYDIKHGHKVCIGLRADLTMSRAERLRYTVPPQSPAVYRRTDLLVAWIFGEHGLVRLKSGMIEKLAGCTHP